MLKDILIRKNIDSSLQQDIIMYLDYIWHVEEAENAEKRLNFFSKLSSSLREEYLMQTSGKALHKCEIFKRNFSENSLRRLVHIMKAQKFAANEIIFEVLKKF
jgi:hypothetical protein